MFEPSRLLDERKIHLVFEVSLWLKGVFALSEVIAGVAAYFISQQFLLAIVLWVTKEEFAEDPHDIIANSLLHAVQNFSVSTLKGPEAEDYTLYSSHSVWQSKRAFEAWTKSEEFRAAHARAGNETTGPLYLEHPKFEGFEVRQTITATA
jgi:heme-degrading monooxygenase HmoA